MDNLKMTSVFYFFKLGRGFLIAQRIIIFWQHFVFKALTKLCHFAIKNFSAFNRTATFDQLWP